MARVVPLALALLLGLLAPAADARQSIKKSIWGPVRVNGVSQFPIYRDLGVGIFQIGVTWERAAPTRPANPTDPRDPAYRWPAEVADAIREAQRYGIRVAILLHGAPPWANGSTNRNWAPQRPSEFADFATAASRRYPDVRLWLVWGEPSRAANFQPLIRERRGRPLTRAMASGPGPTQGSSMPGTEA